MTDILSDVFLDTQVAENEYRCAAFIAGKFKPDTDDQKLAQDTTISVYNRLALLTDSMQSDIAQKFSGNNPSDPANIVKNAQNLVQMTNVREQAFSDLVNAITLSAIISVYTGDPTATKTDTLNMTAVERLQLISETHKLLKDGNTDKFTDIAEILEKFFATHEKTRG